MHEYLTEQLIRERKARMEAFAARQRLLHEARGPRRPVRLIVGLGLVRAGQFLLRGVPAGDGRAALARLVEE
jgi:hypothetical protein